MHALAGKMAFLSEPYELFKVASSRNIHIGLLENNDNILISSKENGIIKYDFESHKITHSWDVSQFRSLNAPAIFDENTAKYYAVMNDKELCCWDESNTSLSGVSTIQIPTMTTVSKILSTRKDNLSELIIFDSTGKVFLKSKMEKQAIAEQAEILPTPMSRFIWSDVIETASSHILMAVVTEKGQKYSLTLLVLKKVHENFTFEESHRYSIDHISKGSHIISCNLQNQKLVVLWSDNGIYSYELPQVFSAQQKDDSLAGRKLIYSLPNEFKISGRGLSKAKLGCINQDHLFVVSKCMIGEEKKGIVSVISSKFGTEQTRSTFSLTPESENPSKEQEIISAVYCKGKMVISLSKSIIAIECNVSSSCLAAALGKLKSSNATSFQAPEKSSSLLLVPNKLKRQFKDSKKAKKCLNEETDRWKSLTKLGDPLQTPTVDDFEKELNLFLKKLHVKVLDESTHVENESEDESGEPLSKRRKNEMTKRVKKMLIPDQLVQTVIKRCLGDDVLWSSRVVPSFLKLKCISPRMCSGILTRCFETNSLRIIKKCFKFINGLSSKDVVKTIQYILSKKIEPVNWKRPEMLVGSTLPDLVKIEEKSFLLLVDVLRYPFNAYSLQDALRNISKQETRELLHVLFELLTRQTTKYKSKIPISHEKVIDWVSLVINAKFATIILSQEVHRLIKLFQKIVGQQMNFFGKLQQIEPFLLQLNKIYELPQNNECIGAYSVEKIVL